MKKKTRILWMAFCQLTLTHETHPAHCRNSRTSHHPSGAELGDKLIDHRRRRSLVSIAISGLMHCTRVRALLALLGRRSAPACATMQQCSSASVVCVCVCVCMCMCFVFVETLAGSQSTALALAESLLPAQSSPARPGQAFFSFRTATLVTQCSFRNSRQIFNVAWFYFVVVLLLLFFALQRCDDRAEGREPSELVVVVVVVHPPPLSIYSYRHTARCCSSNATPHLCDEQALLPGRRDSMSRATSTLQS